MISPDELAFLMILAGSAQGQWRPMKVRVRSCPTADSSVGPMQHEPDVLNGIHSSRADSAFIRSDKHLDPGRTGADMQLAVAGKSADAWLNLIVAGEGRRQ